MHKWIAGSTCAVAVLSLAVASAQTYPQTSDQNRRGTSRTSTSTTRSAANSSQRITVTGCVMHGTSGSQTASAGRTNDGGWILSNATMSNGAANQTSSITNSSSSRSGSPSNEGTSAGNQNRTVGTGVPGSTSTVVGTRGTNATVGGNIDTEAHGAGTLGATDQAGSTVGAGATAAVTADNPQHGTYGNAAGSYQLSGITNPNEYSNKRVEITGMVVNTRANASARRNSNASSGNNTMPMLRVTSVRVLGENCQ